MSQDNLPDRFPSDTGDVKPQDLTEIVISQDYQVQLPTAKASTKPHQDQTYVEPVANEIIPGRIETYLGIVVEIVKPGDYWVLLQDLGRKRASTFGIEGIYSDFRVGDTVQVTQGQIEDAWFIVGGPRKKITPLVVATSPGTTNGNENSFIVPFDEFAIELNELFNLSGNEIKILNDDDAIYEISLLITIECTDPEPSFNIFRGITNGAINKDSSGSVSRYIAGTNTDSEIDDTVINDYGDVESGKKVTYVKLGSNYYLIQADVC